MGYKHVLYITDLQELDSTLQRNYQGPVFIEIGVAVGSRADLGLSLIHIFHPLSIHDLFDTVLMLLQRYKRNRHPYDQLRILKTLSRSVQELSLIHI